MLWNIDSKTNTPGICLSIPSFLLSFLSNKICLLIQAWKSYFILMFSQFSRTMCYTFECSGLILYDLYFYNADSALSRVHTVWGGHNLY